MPVNNPDGTSDLSFSFESVDFHDVLFEKYCFC